MHREEMKIFHSEEPIIQGKILKKLLVTKTIFESLNSIFCFKKNHCFICLVIYHKKYFIKKILVLFAFINKNIWYWVQIIKQYNFVALPGHRKFKNKQLCCLLLESCAPGLTSWNFAFLFLLKNYTPFFSFFIPISVTL